MHYQGEIPPRRFALVGMTLIFLLSLFVTSLKTLFILCC
jgi:hypothetical protein